MLVQPSTSHQTPLRQGHRGRHQIQGQGELRRSPRRRCSVVVSEWQRRSRARGGEGHRFLSDCRRVRTVGTDTLRRECPRAPRLTSPMWSRPRRPGRRSGGRGWTQGASPTPPARRCVRRSALLPRGPAHRCRKRASRSSRCRPNPIPVLPYPCVEVPSSIRFRLHSHERDGHRETRTVGSSHFGHPAPAGVHGHADDGHHEANTICRHAARWWVIGSARGSRQVPARRSCDPRRGCVA
jgi:hypothetical protein